jgi:hypothetical protein
MQNSPSGSGLITDFIGILAGVNITGGEAAGKYYVVPGIVGLLAGLVPITPGSEAVAIVGGVQTRQGRLVRTRFLNSGVDVTLGKRKPTKLQWQILDHVAKVVVPAGKEVEIPWGPNIPTLTNIFDAQNEPVDFGSVKWNAGDLYLLQVTLGAVISGAPGGQLLLISGETAYVALPPVAGPLGTVLP